MNFHPVPTLPLPLSLQRLLSKTEANNPTLDSAIQGIFRALSEAIKTKAINRPRLAKAVHDYIRALHSLVLQLMKEEKAGPGHPFPYESLSAPLAQLLSISSSDESTCDIADTDLAEDATAPRHLESHGVGGLYLRWAKTLLLANSISICNSIRRDATDVHLA